VRRTWNTGQVVVARLMTGHATHGGNTRILSPALHVHQMNMPIIALLWAISARVAIEAARTLQNRGDGIERVYATATGLCFPLLPDDGAPGKP
jgi:hypothetical protein